MTINKPTGNGIDETRILAAISYVWILALVPLLLKRDNEFVMFHAKQGLVLFIIEVLGSFVFWIWVVGWILWIAVVVLAIVGFLSALQGKRTELPVISMVARKISF